jgi:hypothetical protein
VYGRRNASRTIHIGEYLELATIRPDWQGKKLNKLDIAKCFEHLLARLVKEQKRAGRLTARLTN